ncbi:cell division cycle 123-like protein [Brachionus plicatilis]|uniref:Cell division cycle 123-like protein n=1 Tax=Brachionus plicatilis TaxID=10195 RepID=A0A3M7QC95_BRAPC|nr:cell division cycle 123-like protein [Brachionus plicatilis]
MLISPTKINLICRFMMKVNQILNCSFDKWYHLFENITIKSEIIPIPKNVLDYLRINSTIILPKSCQIEMDTECKYRKEERRRNFDDSDDSWDEEEEDKNYPDFREFDEILKEKLKTFSNKVFIKLNWSSPKDAFWVLNKLSCCSLSDIYMLLKSSDFISHDLNQAFSQCEDNEEMRQTIDSFEYKLIMREWVNINPSMEFRCFVNKDRLVGISQRECRSFYQILLDGRNEMMQRIEYFFAEKIQGKFLDESFVFDVCLGKKSIKLLDFNPFCSKTDSLLYSWEELSDENLVLNSTNYKSHNLELRLIETNIGVQSSTYSMYSQPKDALDLNEFNLQDLTNLPSLIQKNIETQIGEELD